MVTNQDSSARKALMVFGRIPEKGKVKKRLSATIGEEAALQIYSLLLCMTIQETLKTDCPVLFFYDGFLENGDAYPGVVLVRQSEGHLGERMNAAIKYSIDNLGYGKVCIIGTDCPEIKVDHLLAAFDLLHKNDVVVCPASDGGYCILGTNGHRPQLFEEIEWSSEKVLTQTLNRVKTSGLSVGLFANALNDIDTEADLLEFISSNPEAIFSMEAQKIIDTCKI